MPALDAASESIFTLSGESTATNRKVHFIWMPQDYSILKFAYGDSGGGWFIGSGSQFSVDWGAGCYPVDLESFYANKAGSTLANTFNWVSVLVQTPTGWRVDVFRYDPVFKDVVKLASTPDQVGTPCALDVDTFDQEIHVLFKDGAYQVTVFHFIP